MTKLTPKNQGQKNLKIKHSVKFLNPLIIDKSKKNDK